MAKNKQNPQLVGPATLSREEKAYAAKFRAGQQAIIAKLPQALSYLQIAVEKLLESWDALHEVEKLLAVEISCNEIASLAGQCNTPSDAQRFITLESAGEWLANEVGREDD